MIEWTWVALRPSIAMELVADFRAGIDMGARQFRGDPKLENERRSSRDMYQKRLLFEPDDIDRAVIAELQLDPRQSDNEIARKLGVSPNTVHRRFQLMLDQKAVSLQAIPNVYALGYDVWVVLAMNAYAGKVDPAALALGSLPNIQHVIITTGRFDIFAWAVFRGLDDLLCFVNSELGRIPQIRDIESMISLRLAKSSWQFLTNNVKPLAAVAKRDLDPSDLALIREVEVEPRETITNLAAKLRMSRPSVRKRLESLLQDGSLRIELVANPVMFGFPTRAMMLIKTSPGEVINVANSMASHERVLHVIVCAGQYDIIAHGVFHDAWEMSQYVRNNLGNLRGVVRHETLMILGERKLRFSLVSAVL